MSSVLTNAPFTKTTLTYTLTGALTGTDANGNPTYGTTTGTVDAFLAPYKAEQLQRTPGADATSFKARGELDSPLTFPTGVKIGSVLTCSYAGDAYDVTITAIIPNDLTVVDFGTYFEAEMRPS